MQERPSISAAILAGGAATRLGGRDKGLLPLAGRPLVAWVVEALRVQVDEVTIIANRNHEAYAHHAHTIADAIPGFSGPLAGIAAALAANRAAWLLTVPVDCPSPPPDLVRRLSGAAQANPGAMALVAHDGVRRQPLFALYKVGLAQSAARAALAGHGPQRWQDTIDVIDVDFMDQSTHFTNLNEPGDFLAFASTCQGDGG